MTLAEATAAALAAKTAYLSAINSQSYTYEMGGSKRSLTHQEIEDLRSHWIFWQGEVDRLSGNSSSVGYLIG